MEDVLTDARRIADATDLPLLVDIDTGWGGAFNIAPHDPLASIKVGVAAVHMEDQVGPEALRPSPRQGSRDRPARWSIGSRPPWMRAPTPAS